MKKRNILLSILLGVALSSCSDYLDMEKDLKDRMTIEEVFSKKDYTEEWLANAYSYLANSNADMGFGGEWPFAFSDDIYHPTYKSFKEQTYLEGQWQNSWTNSYLGIRQASIFIQNVDRCLQLTESQRAEYKAQARFVRAFYYWKLLQKYGPIPLVPDEGQDYSKDYVELFLPRNTYDECADYISSEMVEAAKYLPLDRELFNIVRPTRGAALAIRARVLLFAASPLMNGSESQYAAKMVDDKGKRLLSAERTNEKWAKAAAAAKDVMDLNKYDLYTAPRRKSNSTKSYYTVGYPSTIEPYNDGNFSTKNWPNGYADIDPLESYRSVFNGEVTASQNQELIFTRGQNQGGYGPQRMVVEQLPKTTGGNNRLCMTQKQCDAYYMNDGSDCDGKDLEIGRGNGTYRKEGFTENDTDYPPLTTGVSLQYANREPRFYASVGFNGAQWTFINATEESKRGPVTCQYYNGGNEPYGSGTGLITGIGMKKFVRPMDANDDKDGSTMGGHISAKVDVAIRYAEILLIYAEALNEVQGSYSIPSWDGTKTYTIIRTEDELKKGIQPIRIRAGIPDYTSEYGDVDLFREKVKRERQIELMGEGHRYFDLRRWEDVQKEEELPIYGCNTQMSQKEAALFHHPVRIDDIRTRFSERTYFWPISINELYRNRLLTQNPGWQSYK
ncbi:RagB/SusD family nutrient uptake outer membrane protein [uncultured Bacteroides sp.]|uniref:RagB/SusD family nutrient uptake outer membrane protein n=1 Tax=uncultured Bacteroides sp. TaxID=162156 RepID=UPI0025F7E080|nr:RagB/SusD family nutrient uptake outer membrane protein [uncultured Bacteroides sp.]